MTPGPTKPREGEAASWRPTVQQAHTFIGNARIWDFHGSVAGTPVPTLATFDELCAVNVGAYLLGAKAAQTASRRSVIFTVSNAAPG